MLKRFEQSQTELKPIKETKNLNRIEPPNHQTVWRLGLGLSRAVANS